MDLSATRSILICVFVITTGCKDRPPPPSPPADRTTAPAADRTAGPIATATPASGCLGDQGGCRIKPASIEPCPDDESDVNPGNRLLTLDQVLASPQDYAGKVIALHGSLMKSGAGCTEMACEQTCCNRCTAIVTIGDPQTGRYVRLESRSDPGLYRCVGDESLVCCQADARGQDVVVRGTFQVAAGMTPAIYQLWATELCVPI